MEEFQYRFFVAVLSLGAACSNTWAADYPSEQDYFQELPIVISASRLSQPISETPNAMTVINRDMIEASGFRNIADLFKLVPGMYVGYENGHTPIVAYRGTTDALARRMQVLIDGRTVYLPFYGQVDWAELPLDIGDIDRIEVIRGPSAASHGSNSVQGVINIFTRHAAGQQTQLSVRQGEMAVSDHSARWGSGGNNWDYRVTLASHSDSGFEGNNDNSGQQKPINDSSRLQLINLRANYRPTSNDSIDFQLGYSDSTRVNGNTGLALGHPDTLRNSKSRNDFQQLTWLHTVHENSDIQLSYYHIGRNMADDRPFSGTDFWMMDEADINRHELELQHTLITSPANRFVWGVSMRDDTVDSPGNFLTPITWKEYHLFAHDEWRATKNSLLNIGAMVEKNGLGQTRVSPRVAYNYHLTPRHTLRASTSVAYRNPEMIEESGSSHFWRGDKWLRRFTATGGLSPERTFSREVGYIGQLDDAGSTFDARVYHDHIKDIIWVDPVPYIGAVDNRTNNFKSLFSARHTGFESTLNYKLGARSNVIVNYAHQFVGASATGRLTFYPASVLAQYAYFYEKTVPLNSASILFSQELSGGVQLGAGFYHQDKVQVLDGGQLQPLTRRLDLRMAKRFGALRNKSSGDGGEIALVVQNALNDHYADYN
ncbi:MAG: TonB-dependent receptor, partial [Gammaproteobacteria bacterium]|nr:TonB-dependent receptor [Gammaproteobacteria bacterium]